MRLFCLAELNHAAKLYNMFVSKRKYQLINYSAWCNEDCWPDNKRLAWCIMERKTGVTGKLLYIRNHDVIYIFPNIHDLIKIFDLM
jgi:hypothetical protein